MHPVSANYCMAASPLVFALSEFTPKNIWLLCVTEKDGQALSFQIEPALLGRADEVTE